VTLIGYRCRSCLIGLGKKRDLQPCGPGPRRPGWLRLPQPCTDMEKNGKRSLEMIVDARVQGQGRRVRDACLRGSSAVTFRRRAEWFVCRFHAVPPSRFAGEGWGEGNIEEAPRQHALTYPLLHAREGKGVHTEWGKARAILGAQSAAHYTTALPRAPPFDG